MTYQKYQKELTFSKALAREAGKMMKDAFGLETTSNWKADNTPVTEADQAINRLVIQKIAQKFPDDGVLGEEESYKPTRDRLWVVDPIDGTIPFSLGAPLSTFCLALVIDDEPVLGIVFDPYLRRMFWAAIGQGAYMNSTRLHVSKTKGIAQNYIILSGRKAAIDKTAGRSFDEIEEAQGKAFNFRSFAYGSCFVAAGSAVAAVIGRPLPWDLAAPMIIVEEAGGKVTDIHGKRQRYNNCKEGLIASNGLVHERMLELINE